MFTEDPYEQLLDILLEIPQFQQPENRNVLFDSLPGKLGNLVARNPVATSDLIGLINYLRKVGKLENGEWPVVRVIRTAKRYLPPDPKLRRQIDDVLATFEPSTQVPVKTQPEVVIGSDDRLPFHFFMLLLEAQKSVARLSVERNSGGKKEGRFAGTGWLIAPTLLITNYHVIAALLPGESVRPEEDVQRQVPTTHAWFGYNLAEGEFSDYRARELLQFSPTLDYAILRVADLSQTGARPLAEWGYLKIYRTWPGLHKGDRLNIIQHAQGLAKSFAIRSNYYVSDVDTTRVHYLTDTEPGASGSPVFDDNWKVTALHAAATEVPPEQFKGEVTKFHNEGVKLDCILTDLHPELLAEIGQAQKW